MDSLIGLYVIFLGLIILYQCDGLAEDEPGVCIIASYISYMDDYACPRDQSKTCYKKRLRKVYKPVCCDGWIGIPAEDKCIPNCKYGCKGGNCTAPDKCECDPPFMLVGNECVAPVCEPPCVSATCVGANSCRCHDGFHFHNKTHCVPICVPGFFNNPTDCEPRCTLPCANGVCSAPDICTCLPGYVAESETECVPECEPACSNALCSPPNICECLDGYRPVNETHCEPVCDNCTNGDCVAPGDCRCHAGYEMNGTTCTPIGDVDCTNGKCVILGGLKLSWVLSGSFELRMSKQNKQDTTTLDDGYSGDSAAHITIQVANKLPKTTDSHEDYHAEVAEGQ